MMSEHTIREPEQIRRDCAIKLRSVEVSGHFAAILGCLLDENWSSPRLAEMMLTPDGALLGRCEEQSTFATFLGAERDLVRNVHGVAEVAGLDGDEVGYLLGKIAEVKRQR